MSFIQRNEGDAFKKETSLLRDFIALAAMGTVSFVIASGLYIRENIDFTLALIIGLIVFFFLSILHLVQLRVTKLAKLSPKVRELENALAPLSRNVIKISEFAGRRHVFEKYGDDIKTLNIKMRGYVQTQDLCKRDERASRLTAEIIKLEKKVDNLKSELKEQVRKGKEQLNAELRLIESQLHDFVRTVDFTARDDVMSHIASNLLKLEKQFAALKNEIGQLKNGSNRQLKDRLKHIETQLNDFSKTCQGLSHDQIITRQNSEISKIKKRLSALKVEFSKQGQEEKQRLESELQLVQALIKQLAEGTHGEASNEPASSLMEMLRSQHSSKSEGEEKIVNFTADTFSEDFLANQDRQPFLKNNPLNFKIEGKQEAQDLDQGPFDDEMLSLVCQSIEDKKVELYLQPIVSLPDRKVCYYEALTRLRNETNEIVLPTSYIHIAEQAGIMPLIDNIMFFRSVQVIRRLINSQSHRGIFCNISDHTLLDAEFFPEFVSFMEKNQNLSDYLVFEFSQKILQSAGAIELESLNTLAELGFQFSLDRVEDLNIDFQGLHDQAFRFVKIDANIFLHDMDSAGARIHAADMSNYLSRFELQLIVEKIEEERSLKDILAYGVTLGQGYLFSEPRPVRPEVFTDRGLAGAA